MKKRAGLARAMALDPDILAIGDNSVYLDADTHTMIATGHPREALQNGNAKVRHFLTPGNAA